MPSQACSPNGPTKPITSPSRVCRSAAGSAAGGSLIVEDHVEPVAARLAHDCRSEVVVVLVLLVGEVVAPQRDRQTTSSDHDAGQLQSRIHEVVGRTRI